jgi:hypothetical protein
MKILQKLKLNYVRGLPVALFTTTSISTYTSIKYEMNIVNTFANINVFTI